MHEYECPVCHKPIDLYPQNDAFCFCEGEEGKKHPIILVSRKLIRRFQREKIEKKDQEMVK